MRICPVCGKLNPESSRNCDVCGAPLNKAVAISSPLPVVEAVPNNMSGPICPVCRKGNRSASMFCAYCGYRLKPSGGDGASSYALPKAGSAAHAVPPTAPMIPADVSGNIPAGILLKRQYRILRKIAQGGMGAVYEAVDATQPGGQHWAVKEMSPASLPASERRQAISDFRREAQMLATLKHPNLPQVMETFEEMGKHFLVMEFIAGRTLLNVIDTNVGFIPEERIMAWARQIFDVLHYLHSQDPPIIYRDVKPANIMLVESTERIKLIDFGIARFHKTGKMQDTEAFGTAGYAPPEQYGKGQTDQRSDVYALAATLHHLVTKQDPSLNPFNWVPARRLNPHISPTFENALMVATSLDPARRFHTIEEFAQALGILLPGVVLQRPVAPAVPAVPIAQAGQAAQTAPPAPAAARSRSNQGRRKQQPQTATEQPAVPVSAPALAQAPAPTHATASKAKPSTKSTPAPAAKQSPVKAPAMPVAPAASVPAVASVASVASVLQATPVQAAAAAVPIVAQAQDIHTPLKTGWATSPPASEAENAPLPATPRKSESTPAAKPNSMPVATSTSTSTSTTAPAHSVTTGATVVATPSGRLVVAEQIIDLGEARWNTRPTRKINLNSAGGAMRVMVIATQPWIAYNPQHFQGNGITLDVKVKKRQLQFGRVQLQVPNLFAIIWARTKRVLPYIAFWFWLLVLVGNSFGRMLLLGLAAVVGSLLLFEGLMWLWAQHVRLLVPAEKLNTGRILVKSSGGDQQIEVKVVARPSWLQRTVGWSIALVLFVVEIALVTWVALTFAGVRLPLPRFL